MLFLLVAGTRLLFRALTESRHYPENGNRALILGAGDLGELTVRALRMREGEWVPAGFLATSRTLRGRRILGAPVLGGLDDLEKVVRRLAPDEVVLATPLPKEEVEALKERCRALDVPLSLAPVIQDFRRL